MRELREKHRGSSNKLQLSKEIDELNSKLESESLTQQILASKSSLIQKRSKLKSGSKNYNQMETIEYGVLNELGEIRIGSSESEVFKQDEF